MKLIPNDEITEPIRNLLTEDMPAGIRCISVLEGITRGRIYADDPLSTRWAILQEAVFGTVYMGGRLTTSILVCIVETLRHDSDVLFGFWPEDGRMSLLPAGAEYEGVVIDFWDRDENDGLERYLIPPESCRLEPAAIENTRSRPGAELIVAQSGSLERAFETVFGYYLLKDSEIVCESIVGAPVRGVVEMGVETSESFRGRGYATCLCATVIRESERRGYKTYWNCNKTNLPSVALARKLGYRTEREYCLVVWSKLGTSF